MAKGLNEEYILNILENLSENPNDLYTCMQLNHRWSNIAVTILWRNHPWKHTFYSIKFWKPISYTILLSFPKHVKELLVLNNISKSSIINREPMYDYVSSCRYLSKNLIAKIAHGILYKKNYKTNYNFYNNQYYLIDELWKLFLNGSQKIDHFILPCDQSLNQFYEKGEFNSKFQTITRLECSTRISPDIYDQLSKVSKNISELIIYIYFNYPNYDNQGLATLISLQKNLRRIRFISYDYEFNNKECPNISSSLQHLTKSLISLEFKEEDISYISLKHVNPFLTNLRYLSIDLGKENIFINNGLDSLNSMKLPSLEILEIKLSEINSLDPFISLLQKTKYTIKKIQIETKELNKKNIDLVSDYINTITAYCPNIESLNLWVNSNVLNDIEILFSSCMNLKYLKLETIGGGGDDEILEADPFLKLIPSKVLRDLKKIDLIGRWNFNNEELEDFLIRSEHHENFGLGIEFHCVKGDKGRFEEICGKYKEKGILKRCNFEIINA
ncbi:19384_t:CDS:1 [Funneliformis geosporum]|uniref:1864_t:CDS:1 n=1 Tax=Funneliformis geosporum TaxID=1117311 RepID=A0A9W4SBN9_9GLOM|nr:19384_t:CDS:1 [Funneliformis geosporum]CAI2162497.1 1864_t:CDS:1 [Funneliformis geosporum]